MSPPPITSDQTIYPAQSFGGNQPPSIPDSNQFTPQLVPQSTQQSQDSKGVIDKNNAQSTNDPAGAINQGCKDCMVPEAITLGVEIDDMRASLRWRINWELPEKPTCKGYFIQKVVIHKYYVNKTVNGRFDSRTRSETYYELWEQSAPSKIPMRFQGHIGDDIFSYDESGSASRNELQSGSIDIEAWARWCPSDKTPEELGFIKAIPANQTAEVPKEQRHPKDYAGDLYATFVAKPAFQKWLNEPRKHRRFKGEYAKGRGWYNVLTEVDGNIKIIK